MARRLVRGLPPESTLFVSSPLLRVGAWRKVISSRAIMKRLPFTVLLLIALSTGAGCDGQPTAQPSPPPDHLACGSETALSPGNACCADGRQRPDCTLAVSHTGYWELPCPEPRGTTCIELHGETFDVAASGTLTALYTTGPFHIMVGQVNVTLDGVQAGAFEALLPGGTVNAPLTLGSVASGTHTIVLQYSSTDGGVPASWGGFLDLFLKT